MRFASIFATAVAASLAGSVTAAIPAPHARRQEAAEEIDVESRAVDYELVNTTSGRYKGSNDNGVYRWLGMRYGEDTSGAARFKPSKLKSRQEGIQPATQAAFSCPSVQSESSRLKLGFTGQQIDGPDRWTEDCLSINVWATEKTRKSAASRFAVNGKGGAAILFWVYGGSFNTGTATIDLYDGRNLAASEDVVVITFAYRHSIFANPLSQYVTEQNKEAGWNFGLRDMDLALEWVKQNAARFGADPSKITLFGGSSGSTMIDAYGYAKWNKPTVASALIVSSGSVQGLQLATGTKTTANFGRPNSEWNTVAARVGCTKEATEAQLKCMQAVPMLTLVRETVATMAADYAVQFGPTPDGVTWFDDFAARSNLGRYTKLPTMIGTNSNEATLFTDNPENAFLVKGGDAIFTPVLWTCPALTSAGDRARAGLPTWRYQYYGAWPAFSNGYPDLGCYHFAECPILFGTTPDHYLNDPSKRVVTPDAQKQVTKWMQHAWAEFARDPQNGLTKLGWPRYNAFTNSLAIIARDNKPNVTYSMSNFFDQGACSVTVPAVNWLTGWRQKIVQTLL